MFNDTKLICSSFVEGFTSNLMNWCGSLHEMMRLACKLLCSEFYIFSLVISYISCFVYLELVLFYGSLIPGR